jgi:uncharacterized protein YqhQ
MEKKFQYGGQAVIEGVMMRGPSSVAVAVRKPNGEDHRLKRNPMYCLHKNT